MDNANRSPRRSRFPGAAVCFLLLIIAISVGGIAGALLSAVLLPALPALIAFTAALIVVAAALYVARIRRGD